MKAICCVLFIFSFSIFAEIPQKSPVSKNGWLQVKENKICNQSGTAIQLRGIATHGLQWFGDFYKDGKVIKSAINDWGADIVRLSLYLTEHGYLDNTRLTKADFDKMIDGIVQTCVANGAYVILDWHVHHPGDPFYYLDDALIFFEKMSKKYGHLPNVIFEIANEPNRTGYKDKVPGKDVTWQDLKRYAGQIYPVIRKNAPKSLILMGTPDWSSFGISGGKDWQEIVKDQIKDDCTAYVLHFYAASHKYSEQLDEIANHLPIFATEWAAASFRTDGTNDIVEAQKWLNVLNKHKIGWTYWSFAPGKSIFSPYIKGTTSKNDLSPNSKAVSETGKLLYLYLNNPGDQW